MVDPLTGEPDEVRALLLLDGLPSVGPRAVRALVDAFGSARAALEAPAAAFRTASGVREPDAAAARGDAALHRRIDRGLEEAARLGMEVRSWSHPGYPARLRRLPDPPSVLFLRGRTELLEGPGVAVVGARRATLRGREVARRLGAGLAARGVPVVSGLALGVDGAAHAGALEVGGPTVAVLGSGADRAYPRSHEALFRRVVERGLVVSEFLPGTPARGHHFPRRNRILAALAHTVVVVEARSRSGALITVDHALDLGLEVAAVPGPIDTRACEGSNALLTQGARPVVSVEGFVEEVAGPAPRAERPAEEGDAGEQLELPTGPEEVVLALLRDGDGHGVDEVARATGLPPARAWAVLTRLELQGRARRLPGPRYRRAG